MNLFTARLIAAFALIVAAAFPATSYEIPNTETRILHAQDDARAYKLFIFKPSTPAPKNGYPVIYLLDGNSVFGSMVDEVRRKIAAGYGTPAVIVAIGYPEDDPWNARRGRDLTPWDPAEGQPASNKDANQIKPGGADDFLTVITNQIIPAVEKDYTIDPNRRTLAGHSFGGLFTLHTFFKKTGTFQNYAAASPSIWYANERLFEEFKTYAASHKNNPDTARLLIMVGGCEETAGECDPARPPAPQLDEWLVTVGKMVSNTKTMYSGLHELLGKDVYLRVLEGENHMSVIGGSLAWTAAFAMTAQDSALAAPEK